MNLSLPRGVYICSVLALPLILTGCGDDLDCSAGQTRNLVYQIATNSLKRQVGPKLEQIFPGLSLSLADIVTEQKANGKAMCSAQLHMSVHAQDGTVRQSEMHITYRLERTDDGRLYATVYGL